MIFSSALQEQSPTIRNRLAFWLALPIGIAMLVAYWRPTLAQIAAGGNDFLAFYSGARLLGSDQLYDAEANRRVQLQEAGMTSPALTNIRLPVWSAVIWPLSRLPYQHAYRIWVALSFLALAGVIALHPRKERAPLALALCWSLPLSCVFANGQDVVFLLVCYLLAMRMEERRLSFAAGLVLSLTIAKYHLFLLMPIALLAQRRWRLLGGYAAGAAACLLVSTAVAGFDWPAQYLAALRDPVIHPEMRKMPNLRGAVAGLPIELAFWIATTLAVAFLAWRAAARSGLREGTGVALTGGIVSAYHCYPADAALLIAPLLRWGLFESGARRVLALSLLAPPLWALLLGGSPAGNLTRLALVALVAAFANGPGPASAIQRPRAPAPASST